MSTVETETATGWNRMELLQIADSVAREKNIDPRTVLEAMEEAIQMPPIEAG